LTIPIQSLLKLSNGEKLNSAAGLNIAKYRKRIFLLLLKGKEFLGDFPR
jgi:hypothetical protein